MKTLYFRKLIGRSPLRLGLFLIGLALASFELAPTAQAAASQTDTSLGKDALKSITNGVNDTALGYQALKSNTAGSGNTANGSQALLNNTTGGNNTAVGFNALFSNTTVNGVAGVENTATGASALYHNTTGSENTANGLNTLTANTTGYNNTAVGFDALASNTTGYVNTATGSNALFNNIDGYANTAVGEIALYSNTHGHRNTALGEEALASNTEGSRNTAIGMAALFGNLIGEHNSAFGHLAIGDIESGNFNIGLGFNAGWNLYYGDNNVYIGNPGPESNTESNTIRIGNPMAAVLGDGSTQPAHTSTFIAGIYGATTSDAGSTIPVYVDMNGNLGTAASSQRFKRDIRPMDNGSEAILALKPVTFQYKSDSKGTPQFGLIGEEVAKLNPDLVVRDRNGEIYTVRYEAVNAMLLNEFLKAHHQLQDLKAIVAEQQKQIEALTAGLQTVSTQIEMSRPAPQTVLNDR